MTAKWLQVFSLHYQIYLLILAAGCVAGLLNRKNNKAAPYMTILLGLTFMKETCSKVLAYTIHNDSIASHIFNPVQAIVWGWFFYKNMDGKYRPAIVLSLSALMAFELFTLVAGKTWNVLAYDFIKLECIFLLFFSVQMFISFLERPSSQNIFRNSIFIVSVAVIWYNMIDFIYFNLFGWYVRHTPATLKTLHYFVNYTYYGLLLIIMLLKDKPLPHEYK